MTHIPSMKTGSLPEFLNSTEGQRSAYFLNEYLDPNATLRRRRLLDLITNYKKIRRKAGRRYWKGHQVTARRLAVLEIVSQTLMVTEDLAAFCLACSGDLEDIPSNVIGYKHPAINSFYQTAWAPRYVSDLFLFPNAREISSDEGLIEKINVIQNQNVEAFIFSFGKIVEYRRFFGRLHNKNKHGNTLLFRVPLAHAPADIEPEDLELVFILDSKEKPFDDFGVCIVGKHTVTRSTMLMYRTQDMLVTLIHRYIDYLRYQASYPPLFVFGENPLARDDWIKYRDQIRNLLPSPLQIPSHGPKCDLSVEELYKWLHTTDWSSKWFRRKAWEYKEGAKILKPGATFDMPRLGVLWKRVQRLIAESMKRAFRRIRSL